MKKIKIYQDQGEVAVSEINAFEKSIGYQFPESYKQLLSEHNAVWPYYETFGFYNSFLQINDEREVSFYGYGDNLPHFERIDLAQVDDGYCPEGIVVVGYAANGDYICFDYRRKVSVENPVIAVMYHDAYNEDNTKMYVDFVANNFDEFMDSLYGFDDNDQKIVPD